MLLVGLANATARLPFATITIDPPAAWNAETVYAPRGGRAECAGGIAIRRLGRPRLIDGMVLEIVGHRLAFLQPFEQLGGRHRADDHGAGQQQVSLDRMLRQRRQNILHQLLGVDVHDLTAERLLDRRRILRGVCSSFEIDAVL